MICFPDIWSGKLIICGHEKIAAESVIFQATMTVVEMIPVKLEAAGLSCILRMINFFTILLL